MGFYIFLALCICGQMLFPSNSSFSMFLSPLSFDHMPFRSDIFQSYIHSAFVFRFLVVLTKCRSAICLSVICPFDQFSFGHLSYHHTRLNIYTFILIKLVVEEKKNLPVFSRFRNRIVPTCIYNVEYQRRPKQNQHFKQYFSHLFIHKKPDNQPTYIIKIIHREIIVDVLFFF